MLFDMTDISAGAENGHTFFYVGLPYFVIPYTDIYVFNRCYFDEPWISGFHGRKGCQELFA